MWLLFFTITTKVFSIKIFNNLAKCVAWSPHELNHLISLLPSFLTLKLGFHILSASVRFKSFVETFVVEALHEDIGTIFNLFMFVDLQMAFAMFSLYYA
jgi:hypothetical protein